MGQLLVIPQVTDQLLVLPQVLDYLLVLLVIVQLVLDLLQLDPQQELIVQLMAQHMAQQQHLGLLDLREEMNTTATL
jgi:hypothetical protein